LERRRRCGWLSDLEPGAEQLVWIRRNIGTASCPTSYITPESLTLLEEFHAWKLLGAGDMYNLPARTVDAIFVLERELRLENRDGTT